MEKIIGLNTKTLEEKEFNSINEASEYINSKSIQRCLDSKAKSTMGWIFRYKGEDFPEKSKRITDKRIKVYVIEKDGETVKLPMEMIQNLYGIGKSSLIEASEGYKKDKKGNRSPIEYAKGYKVREATEKEKEEVLDTVSYIDYLYSYKNPMPLERKESIGEGIVKRILETNNITFEQEKEIPNSRLLMDFYIEDRDNKVCIEYQGVHHDKNRYKGRDYQRREESDKKKKDYCEKNDIILLEIMHNDTIDIIYNKISEKIKLNFKPSTYRLYRDKEIDINMFLKYYETKTRKEMAELYGYTQVDIKNILDKLEYKTKRKPDYKLNVYDKETGEHVFTGGYYEVLEKYPSIQQSAIPKILRGDAKSSGGYTLEKVD